MHRKMCQLLQENAQRLLNIKKEAQREIEVAVCLYHQHLVKKNEELDLMKQVMIEKDMRDCKLKDELKKHKKEVSKEVDHASERKDMPPLEKSPIKTLKEQQSKEVDHASERKDMPPLEKSPIKTLKEQLKEVRKVHQETFRIKQNEQKDTTQQPTINLETESEKENEKNLGAWKKHNKGFADHYMKKCEYAGGGLGKNGDGIVEPIQATKKTVLGNGNANINVGDQKKEDVGTHSNTQHEWPKGTTLIVGDSMIGGVQEYRLRYLKAKVRVFPGATISDMHDYIKPLLKKKPTNIILHVCTNDAPFMSSDEIIKGLKDLMDGIMANLPGVNLYFSCPTLRRDDLLANSIVRQVAQRAKVLFNGAIEHVNIDKSCISLKGLHFNEKGTRRLASNYISLMQRL